jgi:hypothetical protein
MYYTIRNKKTGKFVTIELYIYENGDHDVELVDRYYLCDSIWVFESDSLAKMILSSEYSTWNDHHRPRLKLSNPLSDYEIVEVNIS